MRPPPGSLVVVAGALVGGALGAALTVGRAASALTALSGPGLRTASEPGEAAAVLGALPALLGALLGPALAGALLGAMGARAAEAWALRWGGGGPEVAARGEGVPRRGGAGVRLLVATGLLVVAMGLARELGPSLARAHEPRAAARVVGQLLARFAPRALGLLLLGAVLERRRGRRLAPSRRRAEGPAPRARAEARRRALAPWRKP